MCFFYRRFRLSALSSTFLFARTATKRHRKGSLSLLNFEEFSSVSAVPLALSVLLLNFLSAHLSSLRFLLLLYNFSLNYVL
uniref:Putative secreted protein n=1 Tax=Anopheles triannulatus TaxID=58253 RepID=A0A2M4B5J9_9DIPT